MASIGPIKPHVSEDFEPVAIVGMGCRWPGDSESPSELWDFLQAKKDAYSKFPSDRINTEAFYHPDGNRPGSFKTEGGCFIKSNVRDFDHTFFGIHPKEVMSMDPAQRKLLEVVYEAFESAGVPLHKLAGSKTGCFVGNFNYDHQLMHYRDAECPEPYSVTGGGITVLSNRVNYIFDLKGPSMTLDTACSSSMYALHLACSAIQTGECTAAVVGGSNLILTPECQIFSSVLGAVSATSVCHTFDAAADGYARADGIGALYIKKLSNAVADGDPIRAVIRATAINANGRTGGITHPSPDGQEAVMRRAYERAGGLDPSLTGYFECHGTGTPVGDPLEVKAIGRLFADTRSSATPLLIGAIKTNMGHSEPTSGIAGVMKAVISIEHGLIPPTIGLKNLNPNIELHDGKLKIVTESTPWPDLPIRRASINSFGYGGANAHAIIESVDSVLPGYRSTRQTDANSAINGYIAYGHDDTESITNGTTNGHTAVITNGHNGDITSGHANGVANGNTNGNTNGDTNDYSNNQDRIAERKQFLLAFSAHDEKTLHSNVAALRDVNSRWDITDIAYTLGARRSLFFHRSFLVLDRTRANEQILREKLTVAKKQGQAVPKIGFIFTGQGAQWPQMSLDLMNEFPSYLKNIRTLDKYLDKLGDGRDWTIEGVLRRNADESRINDAEISQPLVTAIQISLVNLLALWEIIPAAVAGHSSGEIAASYAAGLISERDAMLAAYLRGKAVARNSRKGLMMAVGVSLPEIQPYLAQHNGKVIIACHNSPESLTLSGNADAVLQVKEALEARKLFARLLSTGGNAYHSHHMTALGQRYEDDLIASVSRVSPAYKKARLDRPSGAAAFFSSVYGEEIAREILGANYWRQNLESPVLFHQAVTAMVKAIPVDVLVEIGPHSALQGPLRQLSKTMNLQVQFPEYLPAIVRYNNNVTDVLTLAGRLFMKGYTVDIARVNAIENRDGTRFQIGKVITDLPHYQWQYPENVLLYENRYTREWRLRMHPRHDILGSRIPGGVRAEPTWRNVLKSKNVPWLTDHRLGKEIVFPSTGYLALVLEAATQALEIEGKNAADIQNYEFRDVTLQKALIVPEDDRGVETLLTLRPAPLNTTQRYESRFEFVLTSVVNENGADKFTEHCRGLIDVDLEIHEYPESALVAMTTFAPAKKNISSSQWYEKFARMGLCYGPIFQGLQKIKAIGDSNLTEANIDLKPTAKVMTGESRYVVHPAALDAAMQLSILAAHKSTATKFRRAFMPTAFESIKVWPAAARATVESAHSVSKATLKGVRGLSADLVLLGANKKMILEAKNIFLIASDQTAPAMTNKPSPYTRMIWKPEFDCLNDESIVKLYPPVVVDDGAIIPSLNNLALHQLIHFRGTNPEFFKTGSSVPHLQRLLDWTESKLTLAKADPSSPAQRIMDYSDHYRAEEIDRIAGTLNVVSSESRLMCHLYSNLPAIYRLEKTGIQVALQDNLLLDNYEYGQVYREGNQRLAAVLSILGHQKPNLKILEVGAGTGSATTKILPALQGDTPWRQYLEYRFTDTTTSFLAAAEERFQKFGGMTFGSFDMEKPGSAQGYEAEWDLIVASNVIHATSNIKNTLLNVRSVLKPGGKLILLELTQSQLSAGLVLGTFSDFWKGDSDPEFPRFDGPFLSKTMWRSVLPESGFSGLDFYLDDYADKNVSSTVVCATAVEPDLPLHIAPTFTPPGLTIVHRGNHTPFVLAFGEHAKSAGFSVDLVPLENIGTVQYRRFIFLVEVDRPLFLDVTPVEWNYLKICLHSALSVLWVTSGNLMKGEEPLFAMVSGIARGLKTETSQLRFNVLDLDGRPEASDSETCELIVKMEARISDPTNDRDDTEFRRKQNITYISRLAADNTLNEQATAKANQQVVTQETRLASLKSTPLQLAIDKPGVLSTLYFKEDPAFYLPLAPDEVEIEVQCAGVNNKDIAVLTGRHHSDTFSDECSGTITKIGSTVTDISIGDRVYCQSFAKFGNFVRDKASFCQKLQPGDTFEDVATMPIAFCTVIYSLIDLGRLQKGETVLIQAATGAVGLAAIQIARMIGAEIYATVGTPEKKAKLLGGGYDIKEDHILWSRDKFSPKALLELTGGKGIDVILCSARGDLMHDYWRCIAFSGRFIEIGRTEILSSGSLNLDMFQRNATFASFDLEVLSQTRPDIIARLMARINQLKVQRLLQPIPYTTYHISEIDKALMTFSKGTHIGKILLSYDHNSESGLKVRQSPFTAKFDAEAAYLLVGCLGGLGRSFSNWAIERGAKNLVFLSRSGAANPEAQGFLNTLHSRGVNAEVVKGDVSCLEDVNAAVAGSNRPIKGVIQGALTLHDGLFESMSLDRFYSTVRPRVIGTLNLHEALKDSPLDFFEMWSSWTVMFGTATQSNYLASNAFLDAFARHRNSLGLPGTSLALSQVLGIGVVSYMPEYQQAMIRNGFYGNDEDEFLQFCEAGISPPPAQDVFALDRHTTGHLLVGIEPAGLEEVDKKYPIDEMVWSRDPRFGNLIQATRMLSARGANAEGHDEGEGGTILERIRLKVSRLLYVPLDEVDVDTAINEYGIDSMIAAELRNWLFMSFGKDVSLLNLLSSVMTIHKLADEAAAPAEG